MKENTNRHLDDQAKIFSLSCHKKDTSIFRLTVKLKEKINEDILLKSTNKALKKYKAYKVQLKKGFFWYTLIPNNQEIIIHKGIDYKFNFIHGKENNNYLFKISYEDKTINVDFFHLLTDGSSGRDFLNEILSNYLITTNPDLKKVSVDNNLIVENSYIKNYKKTKEKAYQPPQAFQLHGTQIEGEQAGLNQFIINIQELKEFAKSNNCSITECLSSMITYSIYNTHYKQSKSNKPINICIPINLKKYFPSNTITNFVSHMMLSIKIKKDKEYTYEEITSLVKEEFQSKLTQERIATTMTSNGKSINNVFVNILPLPIKKFFVILGSFIVKRTFTMTISNLGTSSIPKEYEEYIERYSFILPPDWLEKIRCAISSHKDNLIVSFASNIQETSFEKQFEQLLKNNKISYNIDGNKIKLIEK